MALTDVRCRKAQPREKPYKLFDTGGLYLLVSPGGTQKPEGRKHWRLKYRFAGKEKLLALGVYSTVSLAEARQRRDGARAFLSQGIDPISARREAAREHIKAAALDSLLRLKQVKGGRLVIETPSITVRLTKAETDALRAFLLAKP